MKRVIPLLSIVVLIATGCASLSGVVTGTSGSRVDSRTPDILFVSAEGRPGSFNWARYPIAVVAFTSAEGSPYRVDPRMASLCDQLWDLPVTVAQFSLPAENRPVGLDYAALRGAGKSGMIFLLDAQRLAWNGYGAPPPGELLLLGEDGSILMTGSLTSPELVLQEARRLGEVEKQRRQAENYGL
ncbi:MAG: hypothetical protein MUP47_09100 [Phycisphaerae bacterium]|nr:hypothetical protein [Phycisphaerae bacterium]